MGFDAGVGVGGAVERGGRRDVDDADVDAAVVVVAAGGAERSRHNDLARFQY